jgi:hypothetical protein
VLRPRRLLHALRAGVFKLIQGKESTISWLGCVEATLVGPPGEVWDDIAILEWPSFDVLRDILLSAGYEEEADPHRRAALEDWRLIVTTATELPIE